MRSRWQGCVYPPSPLVFLSYVICYTCAADRRPIDPPIIVQLRVIDPAPSATSFSVSSSPSYPSMSSTPQSGVDVTPRASPTFTHTSIGSGLRGDEEKNLSSSAQGFLDNPYYFMFASLAKPDEDKELHLLKVCCVLCSSFLLFFSSFQGR